MRKLDASSTQFLLPFQKAFIISLIIWTGGCLSTISERIYIPLEAKSKDQVSSIQILRDNPSSPFQVIADAQMYSASEKEIKAWGAKVGADAVIASVSQAITITNPNYSSTTASRETIKIDPNSTQQVYCTAIIYE